MATPDVSVVIPTRNRRALLGRALASALHQKGVHMEVIVVDDGSGDGTADFVRGLGNPRVSLVRHETSKGVSAARNSGLLRARAPWVAFLDDDDLWAPDKLALQLEAGRGASWVCAGAVIVDVGLNVLSYARLPDEPDIVRVLSYNCVPGGGSGPIVRTELARDLGGFDTSLSVLADWDMWIRLFIHSMPAYVHRPLVGYVRHPASMSHLDNGFSGELERITAKYVDARRARGVEVSRDRWLKWSAAMQLRAGNQRAAVRIYIHLIRRHHDWESIARVAMAALLPGTMVRYWSWHLRQRVPGDWYEEAESWLASIRAQPSLFHEGVSDVA